jgi:hypothetical protein
VEKEQESGRSWHEGIQMAKSTRHLQVGHWTNIGMNGVWTPEGSINCCEPHVYYEQNSSLKIRNSFM